MDIVKAIEIFAFVTGILYVLLEIGQKNLMWIVGILTGAACAYSFGVQRIYASMGLNVYYVVISVIGLVQWRKDGAQVAEGAIHLTRPSRPVYVWSTVVFVAGSLALIALLRALGDPESPIDAIVTVMSAIGTWWLAKSYPEQWMIWIVADVISCVLCIRAGLHWMSVLYLAYAASAVYGYFHWMKKGEYIE